MALKRNRLYLFLAALCTAGYLWLYLHQTSILDSHSKTVCLIKQVTGIPCPSCGTTRALLQLVSGEFITALIINPFSVIAALFLLITPVWIIADSITRKRTLVAAWQRAETFMKKPVPAVTLIVLAVANWIWTITKDL